MQWPQRLGDARSETRFAVLVALGYLLAAAGAVHIHELWRDETHAWVIARDAATPLGLLQNLRYDGHPLLWHLCLWPLTRLGGPGLMQALAVAFGTVNAFLFARFAPFSRRARALFAFGLLSLWEWGAIARNYGIGITFLLVAAILMVRRERHPIVIGLALALAANTSAFAAVVVGGLVALLVAERLSSWRAPEHAAPPFPFWSGVAVATAGIGACALQVMPPPDSAVEGVWASQSAWDRLGKAIAAPVHGFATLPWGWPLEALLPLRVLQIALAIAATLALATAAALVLSRRRGAWIAYALPGSALLVLFFLKYYGGTRHAGFIFLAMLLALWVAPTYPPRPGGPEGRMGRAVEWAQARLGLALTVTIALQVAGSAVQCAIDGAGVYSAAGATADLIRAAGLAKLPMVADPDDSAENVLAQLGKRHAFYENVKRWGSFAIWDSRHAGHGGTLLHRAPDEDVFARAQGLAKGTDVVVLIDREAAPGPVAEARARLIGTRHADVRGDESYWVYLVPAAP